MSVWKAFNPSRIIHSIRAKSDGERVAHCIVRRAFLADIVADERTRDLFAAWGRLTGIDVVTNEMSAVLDAAAARARLPHRSAFLTTPTADDFIPRAELVALRERGDQLLAQSLQQRWTEAQSFVVAGLYGTLVDEEVPVRGWLAADLMQVFQEEVTSHIFGDTPRLGVPLSPATVHTLKKGQRPKRQGEHLERYAHWHYRLHVGQPRATPDDLANEYGEQRAAEGVHLAPRDARGLDDRPDTSLIRHGDEEAKRLLTLAVPPEQWATYFAEFWPDRGGKTPS